VPIGTGLFLGSDYLGYYNGSTWKTYMDRNGNFYLGGSSAGCGLAWDSAKNCLTVCGCVTSCAGTIAGWNINAKCISKGNLILNSDGAISGCYSGTTTGWCINAAGDAVFNNATVRGTVCASTGCIGCYSLSNGCLVGVLPAFNSAALELCYGDHKSSMAPGYRSVAITTANCYDRLIENTSLLCYSSYLCGTSSNRCATLMWCTLYGGSIVAASPMQIYVVGGSGRYAFYTNGKMEVGGIEYPSDRNLKCAFENYNVLDKLRRMPIQRWKFKDDNTLWHVGPMAQDFHDIFNFGYECTKIPNLDGLALRAAQELDVFVQKHEEKIDKHDKCIADLKSKLQKLECEMAALREMIN
jgi:hypothetical protein